MDAPELIIIARNIKSDKDRLISVEMSSDHRERRWQILMGHLQAAISIIGKEAAERMIEE